MIQNKKILITGVAGSIGSELARQLRPLNDIYGIDIDETALFDLVEEIGIKGRVGDIANRDVFDTMVARWGTPQMIFHAAARKHVTPMEWNPEEAVHTNLYGLLNTVRTFPYAKFVFISTDKAAQCDSVMGTTKRLGELIVKNAGGVSVRFGNVLGSQGSVIPIWQKQINEGRPVTVTDEKMERFFMTIQEACSLVITAAEEGEGGYLYILDMGKPVKIIDIAKRIIEESRKDIPITITGARPGEKLSEILMTKDEENRAEKKGKFYILKA